MIVREWVDRRVARCFVSTAPVLLNRLSPGSALRSAASVKLYDDPMRDAQREASSQAPEEGPRQAGMVVVTSHLKIPTV